ncbi:MAG TPA: hypothetical protein VFJ82_15140 [Longimicrobium sp.]|nr:hypothetical protein [Longimicrobium sp.]
MKHGRGSRGNECVRGSQADNIDVAAEAFRTFIELHDAPPALTGERKTDVSGQISEQSYKVAVEEFAEVRKCRLFLWTSTAGYLLDFINE